MHPRPLQTISSLVSTYPSFSAAYSSWCLPYWSVVLSPKWGSSADGFICQSGCPLIEAVSCVIRLARSDREPPAMLHLPLKTSLSPIYTLNQQAGQWTDTSVGYRWADSHRGDSVVSHFNFFLFTYIPPIISLLLALVFFCVHGLLTLCCSFYLF